MSRVLMIPLALGAALAFAPLASAQQINIEIGERLEDKRDEYGSRDLDQLEAEVREAVSEALAEIGANHSLTVDIVLDNAWPNRPTREQLADRPGLSIRSLSRGGADLSARFSSADGTVSGTYEYDWRTIDLRDSAARSTWTDARRTIDRFADRLAERIVDNRPAG